MNIDLNFRKKTQASPSMESLKWYKARKKNTSDDWVLMMLVPTQDRDSSIIIVRPNRINWDTKNNVLSNYEHIEHVDDEVAITYDESLV